VYLSMTREPLHEGKILASARLTREWFANLFTDYLRFKCHWAGTSIGDDPDGLPFRRVREGLDKWLTRQGIPGGLTAIWVRERRSGGLADVVHCHLLFHLAHPFLALGGRLQVEGALDRLIDRHGRGNYADRSTQADHSSRPERALSAEGGGPDVWQTFGVPMSWRKRQGLIVDKRCGTTENIGPAARHRWSNRLNQSEEPAA
jgi:hypothetical protein